MRLMLFFKLMVISLCASLAAFALLSLGIMDALRTMAVGTVLSIAITAFYPEVRGIRQGDPVSVVSDSVIPSLIGRPGWAAQNGKRNEQIRIRLHNGTEAVGVIESYTGLISPPKIRIVYEEKLVE